MNPCRTFIPWQKLAVIPSIEQSWKAMRISKHQEVSIYYTTSIHCCPARGQYGRDAIVRPAFPLAGDRKRCQHRGRLRLSSRLQEQVETHVEVFGLCQWLRDRGRAASGRSAFRAEGIPVLPTGEARSTNILLE